MPWKLDPPVAIGTVKWQQTVEHTPIYIDISPYWKPEKGLYWHELFKKQPKIKPYISYSMASTILKCGRKYQYAYLEDLTPKTKSLPLIVGSATHLLMDLYYRKQLNSSTIQMFTETLISIFPNEDESYLAGAAVTAAKLAQAYISKFSNDPLLIKSPELQLEKEFPDFFLYARLDAIAEMQDKHIYRVEHKTTQRTDSIYLSGLRNGLQTGISHWLLEELWPERITGTVFNLFVKLKIPEAKRTPITIMPWLIERTKETIQGVARTIKRGDFFPSIDCYYGNSECDYQLLCKKDTPERRRAFYTSRREVRIHEQDVLTKLKLGTKAIHPKEPIIYEKEEKMTNGRNH